MFTEIILYFLGLCTVCSFLLLWFVSPLKITLAKLLFNADIVDVKNFDDLIYLRSKFLSKLSSCWICCSFWSSLAVGVVMAIASSNPFYPAITFCTYPCLAYVFKRIIDQDR